MPISEPEWQSIRAMIERVTTQISGHKGIYFTTGKVIKRDTVNFCVYLREFGDQPIPIVGFDYTVNYYDTDATGAIHKKTSKIKVQVPKLGEAVLVISELGSQRLPRCVGVIKGKNWLIAEEE